MNETLERAIALSAAGEPLKALEIFEVGVAAARAEGDLDGAYRLLRYAGVAAGVIDPARALRYYEEARENDGSDPYL